MRFTNDDGLLSEVDGRHFDVGAKGGVVLLGELGGGDPFYLRCVCYECFAEFGSVQDALLVYVCERVTVNMAYLSIGA